MPIEDVYTFTQKVKEEIVSNTYESLPRLKALLSAFIRINGKIVISSEEEKILLTTLNGKIARFIYTNISGVFNAKCHMVYEKFEHFSKNQTRYLIYVDEKAEEILSDLNVDLLEEKISNDIVYNDDTICGYLAGSFLASGSINDPVTSNYHLEIVVNDQNYAKWFLKLLSKFKGAYMEAKVTTRRGKYVIYFKKSEMISDFLIVIGAVQSCMDFENFRVNRDYVNSKNRVTNFDNANMKRCLDSSASQVEKIKFIEEKLGLDNITNEKLALLCSLRLEYDSASMSELAKIMSERLGHEVSRSSINHLFRSMNELYERLNGQNE
ncbi:MAG: DNA-binding protein WhiA [Coprobacillus sp.]|nr:DNA-binding protein WhiA [Coprobacillus sp.]